MIDDEEIVKALSLEEKALDEFKRRKNSLPQTHSSSHRNYDEVNKRKTSFSARSVSAVSSKEETDLISFASEVPHTSGTKHVEEDPYNKLKESILKLNVPAPHPQQNLQIIPYNKPQTSLSPEGLNTLYSMTPNINQYYSQHMYFHAQPPTATPTYPAIGFSHFMQQPNFGNYGYSTYYQPNQSQNFNWSAPRPSTSALSISSTASTPTQLTEPKVTNLSAKQVASSATRIVPQVSRPSANPSDNLIDFDVEDSKDANILQSFDPLAPSNRNSTEDAENTYYTDQDPFDYIYSGGTQYSDPLYEAVVRSDHSLSSPKSQTPQEISEYYIGSSASEECKRPPPLPPRNTNKPSLTSESYDVPNQENGSAVRFSRKLYENVTHLKRFDRDLTTFYTMVKELRSKYMFDDDDSNIGHIEAAELDNTYMNVSSIKLLVYPSLECFGGKFTEPFSDRSTENYEKLEGYANPLVFTCDINSNVMLVIIHVLENLTCKLSGNAENYALKTIGSQEWLSPHSSLAHLEYIQSNIKLERDIQLGMLPRQSQHMKVIARTQQDDVRDADIKFENILPKEVVSSISYDTLMILLETLELEIDKLESSAADNQPLHPSGVLQAVKAICALLGCIDTLELFLSINNLKEACQVHSQSFQSRQSASIYSKSSTISIVSEQGNYARVTLRPRNTGEDMKYHCGEVRDAVQHLLEMYSQAFHVNFSVNGPQWNSAPVCITKVLQNVMINIVALHRPPTNWKHDEYMLGVQIYHGTRFLGEPMITHCSNSTKGFYPRLTFDSWLSADDVPVCTLPRESRLVFVLYGCTKEPVDGQNNDSSHNNSSSQENRIMKVELGWSSIQFFDFERNMIQGTFFLSLWPPSSDKYYCPSPPRGTHPLGDSCPVLSIEIPTYGGKLTFPELMRDVPGPEMMDFECLDRNLQEELRDTIDSGQNKIDMREVLWEKRHYLHSFPKALPKILNAAHSWDFACLTDLHAMLKAWTPLKPLEAIELLLPRFPDLAVRAQAVKWISKFSNDDLVDYLPQLLQALKHDSYEASPLSCFLLGRSLDSPRVAHYLYWLLIQNLPGDAPQNSSEQNQAYEDQYILLQARFHRRNQLMLRALLAICGEKLSSRFLSQNLLCKALDDVATSVKVAKESLKLSILRQNIENVHQLLSENPTSLPLSPGIEVHGVQSKTCSYFNSNTLPLKINFMGPDKLIIPAIFKCGDDLQQDMLTLQMVRIIDKMWMKEGLNLKIVTYACIPTGAKKGMIEMITNAETLRKIQVEFGLTGSFKDKPIAEWLAKQNPNPLEYQRAVENFTASCAGYSIITYILGICDRHNDNIMLKTSGHLFHIDFGKFLGDAQMFGNFKRDRVPFVLTSDMAYVINGGDRPSSKFHNFVDLCCQAFNIVRKHGDLLLHMFALMASSGIPGVTSDAVNYVRNALMPGASNPEASANFAKMIHISLKSWFTQFNFFLHNIAQMRFGNETAGGELLSFIPKTYTVEQDGSIENVSVHGYQKRYDLEKYYTYILKVYRQNQPDPAYLFRSYKEFCELHQKLCLLFPLARLHSLQTGISVGRSNIKTVADKRLPEVKKFLLSVVHSASEIINSDIVITFFHPLLRDQQEADIHAKKIKETRPVSESNICGEIKFSIHYHRGTFIVMIHHARSLPMTTSGQEPNTYVKTYLIPDRSKITKRKTKVIKKSCYPSFMETLEYRMPIQAIRLKTLQITVWGHDSLQENEFLGGVQLPLVDLDLKEEIVGWYRLGYLPRT